MSENKKKETMELARKRSETINPVGLMRRFTKDMEHLFEDFEGFSFPSFFNRDFSPFRTEFDNGEWVPQIELLQNDGQLIVRADLPGLTKDDVDGVLCAGQSPVSVVEYLGITGSQRQSWPRRFRLDRLHCRGQPATLSH